MSNFLLLNQSILSCRWFIVLKYQFTSVIHTTITVGPPPHTKRAGEIQRHNDRGCPHGHHSRCETGFTHRCKDWSNEGEGRWEWVEVLFLCAAVWFFHSWSYQTYHFPQNSYSLSLSPPLSTPDVQIAVSMSRPNASITSPALFALKHLRLLQRNIRNRWKRIELLFR